MTGDPRGRPPPRTPSPAGNDTACLNRRRAPCSPRRGSRGRSPSPAQCGTLGKLAPASLRTPCAVSEPLVRVPDPPPESSPVHPRIVFVARPDLSMPRRSRHRSRLTRVRGQCDRPSTRVVSGSGVPVLRCRRQSWRVRRWDPCPLSLSRADRILELADGGRRVRCGRRSAGSGQASSDNCRFAARAEPASRP